ncbi:uncharacterized protein At2g40430 [Ananas comosus]|uniref:Ribosome biogenesis protein NOP53 n=1 Tax=Ananas comosus TaxID=4615 RepID=A0A6P5H0B3_ANACO|nr:uncharacterized protein At2g40430 [Ananas comosus]
MGKGSRRRGKKAWRAKISTEDIDDYFEKATKDALSGAAAALPSLPSDSLFYVDKSKDIPIKRKIEKQREKVLNYERIFQRNPYVQPIPSSTLKKSKKKRKEALKAKCDVENVPKLDDSASMPLDIWDEKDETRAKAKKRTTTIIPAVEVEPPGCSFNPPFEAHQDSLAQAVADEMQKIYKKELGPQPVPLEVTGELVTEEEKYFLDADDGSEDDKENDLGHVGDDLATQRTSKTKKVTRVELNRRARRKELLKAEKEAKKREDLFKEIDSLPDIMKEIAKEDEEKERRHMRRVVAKEERRKSVPPRLGKHKFEPAPRQVLLTEEISGSLRKLKGCCTLARDRFKSLEKRGLLVPKARGSRRR